MGPTNSPEMRARHSRHPKGREGERASEAISSIKSDEFIPDRQKEIARMRGERGQIVEGRRDRGGGMSENEERNDKGGVKR